ncbi:hypothetical protein CDL15_Pgr000285 [Punica granatum]|uniref:Uncharacterized protein n=1 Tax=Punica granatum TaxID=22663 RepID=A0A218Y3E0_PUNGR|nr:hypothetical protein CDL15_Pgr000285 [Punica granatum]
MGRDEEEGSDSDDIHEVMVMIRGKKKKQRRWMAPSCCCCLGREEGRERESQGEDPGPPLIRNVSKRKLMKRSRSSRV